MKNKIRTTLYGRITAKGNLTYKRDVLLVGKHIKIESSDKVFNQPKMYPFDYKISSAEAEWNRGNRNARIITNQTTLLTKLNWWQKQKIRWMFNDHHFQNHWKSYVNWIVIPALTFVLGKLSGLWHLLSEYIGCITP